MFIIIWVCLCSDRYFNYTSKHDYLLIQVVIPFYESIISEYKWIVCVVLASLLTWLRSESKGVKVLMEMKWAATSVKNADESEDWASAASTVVSFEVEAALCVKLKRFFRQTKAPVCCSEEEKQRRGGLRLEDRRRMLCFLRRLNKRRKKRRRR